MSKAQISINIKDWLSELFGNVLDNINKWNKPEPFTIGY